MRITKKSMFISLICFVFLLIATSGCQKKEKELHPNLHVHFNKLKVYWKGQTRIEGLFPLLENTKLKYHEVHREESDTTIMFEFLHNFEDHVAVQAQVSEEDNTILLYLSPNDFHTKQPHDFIGIFFENIPDFVSGHIIYPKDSIQKNHRSITIFNQLEDVKARVYVWKYKDGLYGGCLPLHGKGYSGYISEYQKLVGVKSYDPQDGSDEKNIPIMAIAFGNNLKEVLNSLDKQSKAEGEKIPSSSFPPSF